MSISRKLMTVGGGKEDYVDDVFSTHVYTGSGANRDITNGIDLADKGGLVWTKCRSNSYGHVLHDSEMAPETFLSSDGNSAIYTGTTGAGTNLSLNSDGYSIGNSQFVNESTRDYASWTFAKQEGFFDVVAYTGNGVAGTTIPHNLGSTPGMIIVKCLTDVTNWRVYHISLGAEYWLELNTTGAQAGPSADTWNSTEPTSAVFTVGSSATVNGSGQDYVAYIFAHDADGLIQCGSYEGNGSNNGPGINLGWEPQWLLIKDVDGANSWNVQDVMRGIATNGNDPYLQPNNNSSEGGNFDSVDVTPTGFTIKTSAGSFNDLFKTHIYMAIRRPNKPVSEFDPDELFAVAARNPVTGQADIPSDFPVDMSWLKNPNSTTTTEGISSRLTQGKYQLPSANSAESASSFMQYDYATGFGESTLSGTNGYMFRRAPGFFDVVAQDGPSDSVFDHSLDASPEFIMLKSRSNAQGWAIYAEPYGNGTFTLTGAEPNPAQTGWLATDTTFTVAGGLISPSLPYIAYLWASVPGVCDIGSYTGTGNDLNVDCGFTNGARFVLIKRTDSTGDWYYWDTLRGIVAGNDPYLLLNSTATQVTSTDYIDPLSSGFTVTSSAPAALNASGGEYIYMAIA